MKTGDVINQLDIRPKGAIGIDILPVLTLTVVFCINPMLALFLAYMLIVVSGRKTGCDGLLSFYCIALTLFLGAVNFTRVPENDLIWYTDGYLDAGQQGYLEYILNFGINGKGREIFFPTINYVIYQIIGAEPRFYVFIMTVIYYGVVNFTTNRVCKLLALPSYVPATAALFFAMAPNIFSLSGLLLRQNMAFVLVYFFLVERFLFQKNRYFLMLLSVLTHASTLFFVMLCFIPGIRKRITIANIPFFVLMVVSIFSYQLIASYAFSGISGDNALTYAAERASAGTVYDLPPLSLMQLSFDAAILAALLGSIYFFRKEYKSNDGIVAISNLFIMFLLFIVANLKYAELSVRFNFYYISFFPFFVALSLSVPRPKVVKPLLFIIQPLVWAIFIYGLYSSIWSYSAVIETTYWSFFYYFLG